MKKCNVKNFIDITRSLFSTNDTIPLHEPKFFGNEKKYLNDCVDSSYVSSVGPFVDKFETIMSKYTKTRRAIAVVNGTSSLQICLKLAGVKSDDEVLTQALTFVATANSISYLNAHPVFLDVDLDTMGLSPNSISDFLNKYAELKADGAYNKLTNRKIAACIPMHTFGFMCRMDEIIKICNKWKIPVIEDSAESLGSEYKNQSSGSFGLASAFSFNGNKIITSGGGGAITTNDMDLGNKAKHLTTTAKINHRWEYKHNEVGYNYRMPNINAALLCAQFENLETIKKTKHKLYDQYREFFKNQDIKLVEIPEDTTSWNYWLISVILKNKNEREKFLEITNDNGIMTRPIWTLMYKLPMYKKCFRDKQENAEYLEQRVVNIPSSAIL